MNIIGAYSRIKGDARGITKKGEESPAKGRNSGFLPLILLNLGYLEHTPQKQHVFLEFLVENKAFRFSKRALRAGTARNKWLKKALIM